MPLDKNGKSLKVGDCVAIQAEVTHVHGDDTGTNITVRTLLGMPPGNRKSYVTFHSGQVEKIAAPSGEAKVVATAAATVTTVLIALFALVFSAGAQDTNTAPVPVSSTLWDFVTTGSNYWAAPYGTFGTGSHTAGGGIAVGYHISDVVNPVVRLDYFDGSFWMPSLTAQLQPPRQLMGKIPVIPFGIAGMATPIAGGGQANGTLVTILGAGAALKLDWVGTSKFWQHSDVVVDYEKWMGLPQKEQNQIRFGLLFKF